MSRQANGDYGLNSNPVSISKRDYSSVELFSPDGRYFVSSYGRTYDIWDANSWTLRGTATSISPSLFAFLPDSDHFVTLGRGLALNMYQVGQDEPIDTLDLDTVSDWDLSWAEGIADLKVTANEHWIMINLGNETLLVPLIDSIH